MIQSPHDRLFKGIFSRTQHARQVLRTALPEPLARQLDFRTLRLEDGSFIHETLQMRYSDLLFTARLAGRHAFLYFLFEHQSEPSRLMAFRLLAYMTEIWHKHLREHPRATHLPPIIPIVLHHGPGGWSSSTTLDELYDLPPDVLAEIAPFVPRFSFVLDDLSSQSDDDLRRRAIGVIPTLVLWMFKHARTEPSIIEAMRARVTDLLVEVLRARTGLHALAMLMRYTLEVTGVEPEALGQFLETKIDARTYEVIMTTAERLREEGRKEGREQGREQGRKEGQRMVLLKLLGLRFGPVPAGIQSQVQQAELEQLETWTERVLTATSLSDVFVP